MTARWRVGQPLSQTSPDVFKEDSTAISFQVRVRREHIATITNGLKRLLVRFQAHVRHEHIASLRPIVEMAHSNPSGQTNRATVHRQNQDRRANFKWAFNFNLVEFSQKRIESKVAFDLTIGAWQYGLPAQKFCDAHQSKPSSAIKIKLRLFVMEFKDGDCQ